MPVLKRAADAVSEDLLTTLPSKLADLFTASQHNLSTHRKLLNSLHTLFIRCAAVRTAQGDQIRLTGEKAFGEAFRECVVHPLGVKKGEDKADRVVKFIASFVHFAVEFDQKLAADAKKGDDSESDSEDEDGPASRLVSQLLTFLLKGFKAKSKIARFRCVQLVALMINSLGEIDDETYGRLKGALLERVRDKEAAVRMQAVVALAKLQDADDDEEDEDEEEDDDEEANEKVADVLIDVLTHDPAAEVRRAALFNLIPTPLSLPAILLRTLDIDPINRRITYSHVLIDIPIARLSSTERAIVLRRGLADREPGVRKAAEKLVAKWTDGAGGIDGLLSLLDVNDKSANLALHAVFATTPAAIENVEFGPELYKNLTPAMALMTRSYMDFLRSNEDPMLADLEPVVTALAMYIAHHWDGLHALLESESEVDEQAIEEQTFVLRQLFEMALVVDYGDEIGRRKMFDMMRDLLLYPMLPSSLIPLALDVLLKGTSERDFIRIVVELVQGLRVDSGFMSSEEEASSEEDDDDDERTEEEERKRRKRRYSRKSLGPDTEQRRKALDLRCLEVVKGLLERAMGALQENSSIHGIVHELIVPSVRSKDSEIREAGLVCLGLCCFLDKKMALDSFGLFINQSTNASLSLRVQVLQIIFDLLVLHGPNFTAERGHGEEQIISFIMHTTSGDEPEWLATAVVGTAKLMLSGMLVNEELLERLILLYFASETADNQPLRQCLSYFFPAYCCSSSANQRRVSNVALSSLELLKDVYDDMADKGSMVQPLQIAMQLIDWTDPSKILEGHNIKVDDNIHVDLAIGTVKRIYEKEAKDDRKLYCQTLAKLVIPDEADDMKVKSLVTLIESMKDVRPLEDTVSKNALGRVLTALNKKFGDRLAELDAEEVKGSEEMKQVKTFLQTIDYEGESEPEDEEDDDEEDDEEDEDADEEQAPKTNTKDQESDEEAEFDD